MKDMTSGNPLKLLVMFSIPLLCGNVFQQLYLMADTIIVGKTLGANALAAVGATGSLAFMMIGGIYGLTSGFAVITAQRFGAGDQKGVKHSIATIAELSLIMWVVITVFCIWFVDPMLKMMNTPKEIFNDSEKYIAALFWGCGAFILYNGVASILRALGDSKTPLYFLIVTTILNIAFNILFIYHFHLGVAGSALGTVCAMTVSVIFCLIYIGKKCPILHPRKEDWKLNWEFCKQHLKVAVPMAIQFSIIAVSSAITQSVCNSFGPDTIAAFTSAMRVEQLATQPMVTFGVAMATYVAQNFGAGMIGRIRRGVFECSMISLVLSIVLAAAMYRYGTDVITIFVSDDHHNVIDIARTYLHISILFYFFLGQIFIFRNSLQGMGRAVIPMVSSFIELLLRAFAAVYLAVKFGYLGICYASPIAWVGGSAVVSFGYFWVIRRIGCHYLYKRQRITARGR